MAKHASERERGGRVSRFPCATIPKSRPTKTRHPVTSHVWADKGSQSRSGILFHVRWVGLFRPTILGAINVADLGVRTNQIFGTSESFMIGRASCLPSAATQDDARNPFTSIAIHSSGYGSPTTHEVSSFAKATARHIVAVSELGSARIC
jgi:hypothetical protein